MNEFNDKNPFKRILNKFLSEPKVGASITQKGKNTIDILYAAAFDREYKVGELVYWLSLPLLLAGKASF